MPDTSHPEVVIYTTPSCPDYGTLKFWMPRAGIAFEERDLSNPAVMAEAKLEAALADGRDLLLAAGGNDA